MYVVKSLLCHKMNATLIVLRSPSCSISLQNFSRPFKRSRVTCASGFQALSASTLCRHLMLLSGIHSYCVCILVLGGPFIVCENGKLHMFICKLQ